MANPMTTATPIAMANEAPMPPAAAHSDSGRLHKRSRSGQLLSHNNQLRIYDIFKCCRSFLIVVANTIWFYRLFYVPPATKEMRRRPSILLSMHQSMPEMRVQTTRMVDKHRATKGPEGKNQDQDQAYKNDGETWVASRYAKSLEKFGCSSNILCY
jgi:hypothetical protein